LHWPPPPLELLLDPPLELLEPLAPLLEPPLELLEPPPLELVVVLPSEHATASAVTPASAERLKKERSLVIWEFLLRKRVPL
jgi:hypothetical protein